MLLTSLLLKKLLLLLLLISSANVSKPSQSLKPSKHKILLFNNLISSSLFKLKELLFFSFFLIIISKADFQ